MDEIRETVNENSDSQNANDSQNAESRPGISEPFELLEKNVRKFVDSSDQADDPTIEEELKKIAVDIQENISVFDQVIDDPTKIQRVLESINELAEAYPYFDSSETNVATDFIRRHTETITERLKPPKTVLSQEERSIRLECFRCLFNLASKTNDSSLIDPYISIFLESIGKEIGFSEVRGNQMQLLGTQKLPGQLLDYYYVYGSSEQSEIYKQIIEKLISFIDEVKKEGNDLERMARVFNTLSEGGDGSRTARNLLLEQILKDRGLSTALISDWVDGEESAIAKHLLAIEALEKKRPGITNLLNSEFGIACFGFYPQELLIAQYDELNDVTKPYGVYLSARSDENGAIAGFTPRLLSSLGIQIASSYRLRIIEAGSRLEIAKQLIKLNHRYGNYQKISFAVLAGHGEKDNIQFGSSYKKRAKLTLDDLRGKSLNRVGDFFVPHHTIILQSCSTGIEGGIAQKLSEGLEADVIAPDSPGFIQSIKVSLAGEKPIFDVVYNTGNLGFRPTKMYYSRGQKHFNNEEVGVE